MNPSDPRPPDRNAQWIVSPPDDASRPASSDLVMAWARDQATGEPRYIGELTTKQGGKHCGCECLSCGLPLTAVNAGKDKFVRRPHFRHPEGAENDSCLVLTARAAALQALAGEDVLELPRRFQARRVAGLSGQYYEAWVEVPAERVRVRDIAFDDRASGILTLDDGRQLRVEITGSLGTDPAHAGGALIPTIRLIVDDPDIAAIPPEEIRKRLQLLVEGGTWCAHWADASLGQQAEAKAQDAARDALDWLDNSEDLPEELSPEARRETLLHRLAKEILEREKRIRLPDLTVELDAATDDGEVLSRQFNQPGCMVLLESVALEKSLGLIRPDVVAHTVAATDWPAGPVLIEITVTNTIGDERLERIRAQGVPAIEIDISRMGGAVTRAEFARLVVEEHAGKRWLHHPRLAAETERLERDIATAVATENQAIHDLLARDERRWQMLRMPVEEWAEHYLNAVIVHADLREQLQHSAGLQPEVEEAATRVAECAEALAVHGYPEAGDAELCRERGGILERLLSIRLDRSVGYQVNTAWQVINAILQEGPYYYRWHTLYLIAIRQYAPTLAPHQTQKVQNWRAAVRGSLEAGERTYVRSVKYDRLLALLFPEMAGALAKPLVRSRVGATGRDPEAPPAELGGRPARQEGYVEVGLRNSRLRIPAETCQAWLADNPGWVVISK